MTVSRSRSRRRIATVTPLLAVAALLVVFAIHAAPGHARAQRSLAAESVSGPAPQPLVPPLVVQSGQHFVDQAGKQILLHGVNSTPFDPVTYKQAVALGANLVRIPLYWSDVQPAPPNGTHPNYDTSVLTALGREVRYLRNHGVEALIDFHQFYWSPYFAGLPSLKGTGNARGIPAWLYQASGTAKTLKGRAEAIGSFYTDRTAFAAFTSFVTSIVDRYRKYPNVIGYELLNEPPTGTLPPNHNGTQTIVSWEARVAALVHKQDPLRTIFIMMRGGSDLGLLHVSLSAFGSLRHIALDIHDYFTGTTSVPYSSDGELTAGSYTQTHLQLGSAAGSTIDNQRLFLQPAVQRTKQWNIPLLVGEWGARNNDPALSQYQQQMKRRDRATVLLLTWPLLLRYGYLGPTSNWAARPEKRQVR